jgi:hypothetical protein
VRTDDLERISRFLREDARTSSWESNSKVWHCSCSERVALGTRIATFSYQKALDFPMFQKSWFSAERLLRSAPKWVFIGYSLPAADYEFKYLLKRIQLARTRPPQFIVVTGGSKDDVDATYSNYQRFFGTSIRRAGSSVNFFKRGLSDEALACILSA